MAAAAAAGGVGGILGGVVEAFRLYREIQRDRIADRIKITNQQMMNWRKVLVGVNEMNVQYLFLNSASFEFYFYITKLRGGEVIRATDNFDDVLPKCTDNIVPVNPPQPPPPPPLPQRRGFLNFFRHADNGNADNGHPAPGPGLVPVPDVAHERFCKFIQSILYDVQHFALTLNDLSPAAVSSIIMYALYLVIGLNRLERNSFQVFRNWDWLEGTSRLHAMIVLDSTFECVDNYEGPLRQQILDNLANAFAYLNPNPDPNPGRVPLPN